MKLPSSKQESGVDMCQHLEERNNQLGIGVEIWVNQRSDYGVDYIDGPFRVVAFDGLMVYAVRDTSTYSGDFFPVEEVALDREAAKENLERSKAGQ
ncbi:hypothetical protein LCGC14_1140880 [marine sediment metagenome]|uniref:Uncharacterized protein n=1 Tax=marine sediment metagenome TaxID=412755 RepID=A0A0F9M335_9ZZZZ